MKINTSFEITEDNILSAIADCRREYDIIDLDKETALAAIVADVFGLNECPPRTSEKIADRLLDDDSKHSLLDIFADRLCEQIYHEITERFGLDS